MTTTHLTVTEQTLKEESNIITLLHLSQLAPLVIGFGSLLLPLILWLVYKDKINDVDRHGKAIINFQISLLIYILVCIPLILLLGLGLLGILALIVISLIYPIINAVKVSNGKTPSYPITISFIN